MPTISLVALLLVPLEPASEPADPMAPAPADATAPALEPTTPSALPPAPASDLAAEAAVIPVAEPREPIAQPATPEQLPAVTPVAAGDSETAPGMNADYVRPSPPRRRPEPAFEPIRHGPLLGVSLGFVGCGTQVCDSPANGWRFRGGLTGQVELGYRAGWIAPMVSAAIGGGPFEYSGALEGIEGNLRLVDVNVGAMAFPVKRSRLDPFMGLRFGYARARDRAVVPGEDIEATGTYSRFGVRITAGLGYYVHPRVSIGPRFDVTLPVGGGACIQTREGAQTNTQCFDSTSITNPEAMPRWWSLSLGMHVVLPRRRRQ